jgi:hypothetical protein
MVSVVEAPIVVDWFENNCSRFSAIHVKGNTDGDIEAELREVREIIERAATANMPPEVVGMKERIEEALQKNPET